MRSVKDEARTSVAPMVSSNKNTSTGRKKSRHTLIKFLLFVLLILSPFWIVQSISLVQEGRSYNIVSAVPSRPVAIIFGAGLNRDGSPSPVLADRIEAGIALYRAGKVQTLLMTGDEVGNTEPTSMRDYAVRRGVPKNVITLDTQGLRTYDSCYRAVHIFNITQAVLVTQSYHLTRALYTGNGLGVDAVGLKAGRDNYPNQEYYNNREFLATLLAWLEVTFTRPIPS